MQPNCYVKILHCLSYNMSFFRVVGLYIREKEYDPLMLTSHNIHLGVIRIYMYLNWDYKNNNNNNNNKTVFLFFLYYPRICVIHLHLGFGHEYIYCKSYILHIQKMVNIFKCLFTIDKWCGMMKPKRIKWHAR